MKGKCIFLFLLTLVILSGCVEALSNNEVGKDCETCSTEYDGEYCCSITIKGVVLKLYYPKK